MNEFDSIMAEFEETMNEFENILAEYEQEMDKYHAIVGDTESATEYDRVMSSYRSDGTTVHAGAD